MDTAALVQHADGACEAVRAEALHLAKDRCALPRTGWGELLLTGSTRHAGQAWGDSGEASEEQGLKHRAADDTRIVPACPERSRLIRDGEVVGHRAAEAPRRPLPAATWR